MSEHFYNDLLTINPKLIEYLYCQILKDPKQILADLSSIEGEDGMGTKYYYSFEDELYFQQLKKNLIQNSPSSWKQSADGEYTWSSPQNNIEEF